VGHGSAAIAANFANVRYEGICLNKEHKEWIDDVLDRCALAALSDMNKVRDMLNKASSAAGEKKEHPLGEEVFNNVRKYFSSTIAEGQRILFSNAKNGDEGGDDDMDDGEEAEESS
jgi:hypothetical protein